MSNKNADPQAAVPQPQSNIVDAFQILHDSIGGGGKKPLPIAYLHRRTAELECEVKNAKADRCCEAFEVGNVKLRVISQDEGAVGRNLVVINRTEPKEVLKQRAMSKLSREEREALGL